MRKTMQRKPEQKAIGIRAGRKTVSMQKVGEMAQMFAIGTCPTNAFNIR